MVRRAHQERPVNPAHPEQCRMGEQDTFIPRDEGVSLRDYSEGAARRIWQGVVQASARLFAEFILSKTDCFAALAMTDKRRDQSDNIITRLTS